MNRKKVFTVIRRLVITVFVVVCAAGAYRVWVWAGEMDDVTRAAHAASQAQIWCVYYTVGNQMFISRLGTIYYEASRDERSPRIGWSDTTGKIYAHHGAYTLASCSPETMTLLSRQS